MGGIRKVASLGRVSITRAEEGGFVLLFRRQVRGLARGPLARRLGILILESIWGAGEGDGDEMGVGDAAFDGPGGQRIRAEV